MTRLLGAGAIAGACLVGCGGQAFSVAGSGSSSGASSGSATSGSAAGSSGASTGAQSGASSGSASGRSGSASGRSGSTSGSSGQSSGSASGSMSGSHSGSSGVGSSGSGSGASGASGSADASAPVSCPLFAPNAGSVCPGPGLQCEYGSNPNLQCNQLATCAMSGAWMYGPSPACPVPMCPATYDLIAAGGPCAPPAGTCAYLKGTCVCSQSTTRPPAWSCFPATLACRSPRPDIGTPCTEANRACDYGACSGGIELKCTGGIWQQALVACLL